MSRAKKICAKIVSTQNPRYNSYLEKKDIDTLIKGIEIVFEARRDILSEKERKNIFELRYFLKELIRPIPPKDN